MSNKDSISSFAQGSVSKAVLKNVLPAIVAMIMVLIYNLADTFFIGQTHNDYMVAAVSLATPVFLIFMALGTLFGMGGTSVISRALGEGRQEYAKKVCSFCMWACVAVGIVCMLIFWIFMNQILVWLGASADTVEYTRTYLNIVSVCGVFSMISNCYSNIVRAEGKSTAAMGGTLLGNFLNVILDPIMISGFGWGIAGAAIATVIGNIVGAAYYLIYFCMGKSSLSIGLMDFSMKDGICKNVLAIGIPASMGSLLMSISQMITNSQMANYGDMAVAAYGVSAKVLMIVSLVGIGLGQGIQPLLGYCYGAKNKKRFRESLAVSVIFGLVLCVAVTILCAVFIKPIVSAFLTDQNALDYGIWYSQTMLTTAWLFGVFYVLQNALQAMGQATSSFIVAICRQGIIYIPAVFIMGALLNMIGLVWAQPVADVLSLALVAILLIAAMKKQGMFQSDKKEMAK